MGTATPTCAKNSSCPAGAQIQSSRAGRARSVGEGMRRIGRDAEGLAGVNHRFFSAEGGFDLAFKDGEGFLEVVPMRRRAAAGRDVHIDETITAVGIMP